MFSREPKLVEDSESVRPLRSEVLTILSRDRIALVALLIVIAATVIAILAPFIAPFDPTQQQLASYLRGPSSTHLLGQDELGRDLLSRLMYGARVSLLVGASVVGASLLIGVFLGTVAGYYGGKIDSVIMRIVDIFFLFPRIKLAVGKVAVFRPGLGDVVKRFGFIKLAGFTEGIGGGK